MLTFNLLWVLFTYTEGGEVVVDIQDVTDGVAHSTDDPINNMDHSICGYLVSE